MFMGTIFFSNNTNFIKPLISTQAKMNRCQKALQVPKTEAKTRHQNQAPKNPKSRLYTRTITRTWATQLNTATGWKTKGYQHSTKNRKTPTAQHTKTQAPTIILSGTLLGSNIIHSTNTKRSSSDLSSKTTKEL